MESIFYMNEHSIIGLCNSDTISQVLDALSGANVFIGRCVASTGLLIDKKRIYVTERWPNSSGYRCCH